MDFASAIGTLLGALALIGGHLLGGGSAGQLFQASAALTVVFGTLGATLVSFPARDVARAIRSLAWVYVDARSSLRAIIDEILVLAVTARKEGILAIEQRRASIKDPVLRKSVRYLLEGMEAPAVRELMDAESRQAHEDAIGAASVLDGAGGVAPTIGILGAILGLIQVMSVLNDPSKLGAGIAAAFVAALYGVALANLLLLPWAQKLRKRAEQSVLAREAVKLGVVGILDGTNPLFLKERLETLLEEAQRRPIRKAAK